MHTNQDANGFAMVHPRLGPQSEMVFRTRYGIIENEAAARKVNPLQAQVDDDTYFARILQTNGNSNCSIPFTPLGNSGVKKLDLWQFVMSIKSKFFADQ